MENTNTTVATRSSRNQQAKDQCLLAKDMERAGDFEAARSALSELWSAIGTRPTIENLATDAQAEVLLRVGSVSGRIGSARQISNAQQFAKDLLTESIRSFQSLGDDEKAAEAQAELAVCYWREGAFDEGRVLFREALSRAQLPLNRLGVLIDSTSVEISSGQYQTALSRLREGAALLETVQDPGTLGRYYLQLGLVYKNLGDLDRALIEYSAASFHLTQAGHTRYLARVENNIGVILLQVERYADAMSHLDHARGIFSSLKDTGSVGQVNETRARLFLAQHSYSEAERAAGAAVRALEIGGEQSLLADALITQGVALSRLGKDGAARSVFQRAIVVSDTAGDLRSSARSYLVMLEELQDFLAARETTKLYLEADERLGESLDNETAARMRRCARIALNRSSAKHDGFATELKGENLEQQLLGFEEQLLKRALDEAEGSITRAARVLGMTHQGLSYIIATRHKTLTSLRRPVRTRRRSIISKK